MKNEIELTDKIPPREIKPYEHRTKYHETDQQGIIHHSNYVKWLEEARMDMMDQMGLGFKQMETMEIQSPILSLSVEYRSQIKFDETILIETKLVSYDGHEMEIEYRIYDKKSGEDKAFATSRHCFVNKSGTPISMNRVYPELETKFFEFS